ncbi:MAG: zinc-dependent metalloprotease [Microthrixaceae bacterium]
MSNPGPFGGQPFDDLPAMLEQLLRQMGAVGGPDWEGARQVAASIANAGVSEPNVDPGDRMDIEQFARIAELHVGELTGLSVGSHHGAIAVSPTTRTQWAASTVDAYRGLFERLAESIGRALREQLDDLDERDIEEMGSAMPPGMAIDPAALIAGLRQMMGPMMATSMAGSTVGHLGARAFGMYDLPIPRPAQSEIQLVVANIDAFGNDWSLPRDELRLWICLHEVAHHAVLGVPHVAARLHQLLADHAGAFSAGFTDLDRQLGDIDLSQPDGMAQLQALMSDPDLVFGAIRSERQSELLPFLDALVMVIEGYVDWVLDETSHGLISAAPMIAEAVRRRRVEADQASRFIERLFGLELTQSKIDDGSAFIAGIVERAGPEALSHLWSSPEHLPTPPEIGAPGLWLARVGVDGDRQLSGLDDLQDLEIPDFPDFPDSDS